MSRFDVVVVGGGPAGMACATQARRAGLAVLLMERFALGGELARLNTVHGLPGSPDVQGPDLVAALIDELLVEEVAIEYEDAVSVEQADGGWLVNGAIEARSLVMATGRHTATASLPGATERWGRGVSSCSSCDGPLFKGKRVALTGSGEYAHGMALELAEHAAEVLMFVDQRPAATPASVAAVARRGNVTVLTGSRVVAVEGDGVEAVHCTGPAGDRVEPVSGLFLGDLLEPQLGALGGLVSGSGRIVVDPGLEADLGEGARAYAIGDVRARGAHAVAAAIGDGVAVGWALAGTRGVHP